jgi:hypothetical protein
MRPHYLRTYSHPGDVPQFTWRGRALALLACALVLSCLGACGGGTLEADEAAEPDTTQPSTDPAPGTPTPFNPCTLNPKACT